MDIRSAIEHEHSKANALVIRDYIGTSESRFEELMALFRSRETLLAQRAAWVFSHVVDVQPQLARNFTDDLLELAVDPVHVAVRRAVTRFLPEAVLNEQQIGLAYQYCWEFASSSQEDVAVRVHSLTVLTRIASQFPELIPEVRGLAQDFITTGSAGMKSRARRMIVLLDNCESQESKSPS